MLGQLCWTGKLDVSLEFHPSPVRGGPSRRQICYRHLSRGVGVGSVGQASRRSRHRQSKTDSFGDIIKWTVKAAAISVPNTADFDQSECESSNTARQPTTGHDPSDDGRVCWRDTHDPQSISCLILPHVAWPAWAFPAISGLHSTGRRSLSLPVHFGLALSDWKGPA